MTSTAISAQGSSLSIGNGTGAAQTISAIAVGYPTILTSTAHGFSNGDIVALAAFTGTNAASLNGLSLVVQDVTANTFMVEVNTTGLTITAGTATATPTQWTPIGNFKTLSGLDGSPSDLNVTNLASTGHESRPGVADYGQCTIEVDQDNTDTGQAAVTTAFASGLVKQFKLLMPDTHTITFTGWIKKNTTALGVDQIVKRQIDIRITSAPTYA